MEEKIEFLQLEAEIVKTLKTIYDPEIPVSIYDLGLIYNIDVDDENNVRVEMTLTAPNCPMAGELVKETYTKLNEIKGVKEATVKLVFDPPWTRDRMSEEAKLELGFL